MIVSSSCSRYKSFSHILLIDSMDWLWICRKDQSKFPFKAHVWTLRHKDTVLLHRPYMRALRRIAGAGWKSNETTPPITDSEVRRRLGAPSIECLLIKVRLQYQGRCAGGDITSQRCGPFWTRSVEVHKKVWRRTRPTTPGFNSSAPTWEYCGPCHRWQGSPYRLLRMWEQLAECGWGRKEVASSCWWLALQGKLIWQEGWWVTCQEPPSCDSMDLLRVRRAFHLWDGERPARKKETWTTMHSLAEEWRHLNMSQLYADFRQRFRLVHHAHEKRGKERDCRDFWLVQSDVDSDLAHSLWEQDLTLPRAATKEDRSHAIACGPARRHDGRILGSQSVLSKKYQ